MKKLNFLLAAVFATMFAACSDDNGLDEKTSGAQWNEDGTGYVSLSINLPTQPSTRGVNDNFDDGMPVEYKVNDATLVLFSGADANENTAKFKAAYNLSTAEWGNVEDTPSQITTSAQITQKIESISGNIYALVILNRGNVFTVEAENQLKIDGTVFAGTFEDLLAKVSTADFIKNTNILMLNSPFYTKPGGAVEPKDGNFTTLVTIDADKIKPTRAEAEQNVAANIYVERAVAKTTVENALTETTIDGTEIACAIEGWKLTNTNTKSYIVRNVTADYLGYFNDGVTTNKYRFVGSYPVEQGVDLYRYYWAQDPNYDGNASADLYQLTTETDIKWNSLGTDNPEYCKENTFNVASQNDQNTTAAIVKVKLNGGDTFYTINDANEVYTEEGYKNFLKKLYIERNEVATWFKNNALTTEGETTTFTAADFDFVITVDANSVVTISSVELTEAGKAKVKEDAEAMPNDETIISYLNETTVKKFEGGIAYYPVLIKHFGNDLTPWNEWEKEPNKPTPGAIYPAPDAEKNYLGRYGMVRNNWYELSISAIKKIGSPVVPDLSTDGTSDDDLESYISVKINILSWAKRTQDVQL